MLNPGDKSETMTDVHRGKFEGGDAAWEEKNQGSGYAKSEVRLVEIQEDICKDLDRGEIQVGGRIIGLCRVQ